jgi:hypothetical protein
MNIGMYSGMASAFGALGKYFLGRQQAEDDEAAEQRKLQLKNKLDMDLMKAKFEYAKANPTYSKFVTDPRGNLVAFSQFGEPKVVIPASPETTTLILAKQQAAIDKDTSAADENRARIDYLKSQGNYSDVHAKYLQDRMDNPDKYRKPTAAKPDKYAKDARWFDTQSDALGAATWPYGKDDWKYASPKEKQPYLDGALAKLKAEGYYKIDSSGTGDNPFDSITPHGDGDGDEIPQYFDPQALPGLTAPQG